MRGNWVFFVLFTGLVVVQVVAEECCYRGADPKDGHLESAGFFHGHQQDDRRCGAVSTPTDAPLPPHRRPPAPISVAVHIEDGERTPLWDALWRETLLATQDSHSKKAEVNESFSPSHVDAAAREGGAPA